MMETISYFRVYLLPIACSSIVVGLLAVFNYLMAVTVLKSQVAEIMEVLAYSISKAGPAAFAISFICIFYSFEFLKRGESSARFAAITFWGFLIIGLVLDVVLIPRASR